MASRSISMTHVFFQTSELKDAVVLWAEKHNTSVQKTLQTVIEKMLDSNDYSSDIEKPHKFASEELSAVEHNNKRRVTCGFDANLRDRMDEAIKTLGKGEKAKLRGIFINEAIRRYLEPQLIENGFLRGTVFLDQKQAAKNLKELRLKLGLTQREFKQKFFENDGISVISLPQYAAIERTGKGSIERLIELVSIVLNLDKEKFYDSTLEFAEYIKDIT